MSERPRLGELLIEAGVIDEDQLAAALARQKELPRPLGKTLLEMQAVDEESLTRTLARQLAIPMVWLRGKRIKAEVLERLPWELVEKHRCLPVQLDREGNLLLAVEDPSDQAAIDDAAKAAGCPVKPVLAAGSELEEAIGRHAPADPDLSFQHMEFVDGDESEPDLLSVEPPDVPAAPPAAEPQAPAAPSQNDLVLRAISQLLVEKGLIGRDELVARLEQLGKAAKGE